MVLVVFIGLCRWLFRSAFTVDADRVDSVMELRERDAIRDIRLLLVSLAVLAVVLVAFVTHTVLHLEPSVVALVGGLSLLGLSRLDAGEVAHDVEWPTLAFFAGLFVMVGGLVATGVIDTIASAATDAMQDRLGLATMVLLWASAALSAIVDNIPYVATMSPIVAELVTANDGANAARSCGGPLPSGPTSAVTPPPSAHPPTSSCSASQRRPADPSPSGNSPATA